MQIDDCILILSNSATEFGEELGNIEGIIINLTSKAVQVEWFSENGLDDSENYYRTWLPKSIIRIVKVSPFEYDNKQVNYYAIMLPSTFRLTVTSRLR